MPEMTFTVRWPDGRVEDCYSPSLVMHDHLRAGNTYPMTDFVDRTSLALDTASERVKARYGFECTSAQAQKATILERSAALPKDGPVYVIAMHPELPGTAQPDASAIGGA